MEKFFKDVVEISNANLIRNSRALIATTKVDNKNFVWIKFCLQTHKTTADLNLTAINFFRIRKQCFIKFNSIYFPEKTSPQNSLKFLNFYLFLKTNTYSFSDLRQELPIEDFISSVKQKKFILMLDNQKFNTQCHKINGILAAYAYFLRVFELKEKFRHLIIKNPKKKKNCIYIIYIIFPQMVA